MIVVKARVKRYGCRLAWSLAGAAMLAACSFEVINPGPVQDEFLDDREAFEAIVNGVGRAYTDALNDVAYTGGSVAREIHPGGSSGNFGIAVRIQPGKLPYDQTGGQWNSAQQARWQADHAIARFNAVMNDADFSASELVAQAYLWQGYAYRLLGENMCEVVIDGGPAEPIGVARERAEAAFTNAMAVAASAGNSETEMAARAGRAAVRVFLGDWVGAVSDAALVPDDFVYRIPYFDMGDQTQYNAIHWSTAERPYKAHTVWNTVYKEYYENTADPRTPWMWTDKVGDGAIECCGLVPWWPQQKHDRNDSPINASSGREMRLIEAEASLRDGDWTTAMAIINQLRADVAVSPPLAAWVATNETEAWTHLKRERGIELWLEGRRLGDLRRWQEGNTPGDLHELEEGAAANLVADRDLCFPIALGEMETNPNIPLPGG